MIDGIGSRPFSARTIAPLEKQRVSMKEAVLSASRARYAQGRALVEEKINTWFEPIKKPERRRINDPKTPPLARKKNNDQPKPNPKKVFTAPKTDRDTDGPYKKAFKEFDEKEAELEMKKIVSPRLNELLDKMDFANPDPKDKKSIPKVIENIKKYESRSNPLKRTGSVQKFKTNIPASVSEKAASVVRQKKSKPLSR